MIEILRRNFWVAALLALVACNSETPEKPTSDPDPNDKPENLPTVGADPLGGPTDAPKETAADYPDLKIKTLVEGEGEVIEDGTKVKIEYAGFLTDGSQFDSSYGKDKPLELPLGGGSVIRGWHLGLSGMKLNEKRQLTIPPELAYGKGGRPPSIPPDSTLIFHVTLVEVVDDAEKN